MRRQQMVALSGAVGILACGACFLPPPRPAPRRPPPLPQPRAHLDLHGTDRIWITVSDEGRAHAIDDGMLERCLAESINSRRPPTVPIAHDGGEARNKDTVLAIVMEKADATPEPRQASPSSVTWDFDITLSATLTRADGVAVWHASSQHYKGVVVTPAGASPWSSESFAARARYYLCDPLAARVLTGGG